MKHYWVDRRNCIVAAVAQRRAVQLGYMQFAIFEAIWRQGPRSGNKLSAKKICDIVYNGTKNPSVPQTIRVVIHQANKKLDHIGLKICGVNHKHNSFYQIVPIL